MATNLDGSVTTTNPDGSVTTTFKDGRSQTTVTNQNGTKTSTRKDADGGVTAVFQYDASGKVVSQATAGAQGTTNYTVFNPDGGDTTTVVNPDGVAVARTTTGTDGSKSTSYLNPDGSVKNTVDQTSGQVSADANQANQDAFDAAQKDPNTNPLGQPYKTGNLFLGGNLAPAVVGAAKGIVDWTGIVPAAHDAANYLTTAVKGQGAGGDGSGGDGGSGSTGPLGSLPAVKEADDFAKQLLAERNASQPRPVPQATASTIDLNKAPQAGPAATYGGNTNITATPSARATVGPAGSMGVGSIGAGSVSAGSINPHGEDISLDGEARDTQLRAVKLAEGAANGTAPSAAESLLRKGIDEGVGAQLGVAASLQGRNPGQAMRQGLAGAANVTAKSAADMSALRADEMANARRDFLSGAQGLRTSDVDVQKANQSTALQANLGNLSADTQTKIANLQAQTETAKANLAAQVAAGQANLAAQTQIQLGQLQADMQKTHDDAWNELQAKVASGQLSLDSFKATLTANTNLSMANIDAMTKLMTTNATNQTNTNIANVSAAIDSRKLDDLLKSSQGDQIIAALGLPINAAKQDIANSIAAKASDNTFWASILSALGTYAAAA